MHLAVALGKLRIQVTIDPNTLHTLDENFPYNRSRGIDQVVSEWKIFKKNEEIKNRKIDGP